MFPEFKIFVNILKYNVNCKIIIIIIIISISITNIRNNEKNIKLP